LVKDGESISGPLPRRSPKEGCFGRSTRPAASREKHSPPRLSTLVVTERAKKIGLELAPHDVRRTFAKLAHKGKVPIEQIQLALGHESIQTTERYLGIQQDLINAPGECLGVEID
jgi:integrase